MRRLINEAIRDDWDILGIAHDIEEKTIYIPVNEDTDGLVVTYTSSYPFRVPTVQYRERDLLLFYKDLSMGRNSNDINSLLDEGCMCCESLLCGNKWNVQRSIKNILDEFNKFVHIKKRSIERFWARRIASKLLVEDIPLHDYL